MQRLRQLRGARALSSGLELRVANPQALLNAIASSYKSTPRILMEYVDNALDAAAGADHTPRVAVDVDVNSKTVWVRDNCKGMTAEELAKVVRQVGDSSKRGVVGQNGQFGFGMHAFRAAAERMVVLSKTADQDSVAVLEISRLASTAPDVRVYNNDGEVADLPLVKEARAAQVFRATKNSLFPAVDGRGPVQGTAVALTGFDPLWFATARARPFAMEIENHFEGLLARGEMEVLVSQVTLDKLKRRRRLDFVCKPLDHSKIDGFRLQRSLALDGGKAVHVDLLVSAEPLAARPARFFSNGRRVSNAVDLASFMKASTHKARLWESPHVSGTIEVGGALQPTLTRDEFQHSPARDELYAALCDVEVELMEALAETMDKMMEESMANMENALSSTLAKLLDEDRQSLSASGELVGEGDERDEDGDDSDGESDRVGPVRDEDQVSYEPLVTDRKSPRPSTPRKASKGLHSIRFVRSSGENAKRSFVVDKVIYLNVNHAEFQARLVEDKGGQARFGPRMAAYLANELAVHYRCDYYDHFNAVAPDGRRDLYMELMDSACALEKRLGSNISRLASSIRID